MPRLVANKAKGKSWRLQHLLDIGSCSALSWLAGVEQLRARGWAEGRNLKFEFRDDATAAQGIDGAARQLIAAKVDLILCFNDRVTRAASAATRTIPIVAMSRAPVEPGLVKSLGRPGGKITGAPSNPLAVTMTTRHTIQMSEGAFARTKSALKELVDLRNELVHYLIERFDLRSEEGCAAAAHHLESSYTRRHALHRTAAMGQLDEGRDGDARFVHADRGVPGLDVQRHS